MDSAFKKPVIITLYTYTHKCQATVGEGGVNWGQSGIRSLEFHLQSSYHRDQLPSAKLKGACLGPKSWRSEDVGEDPFSSIITRIAIPFIKYKFFFTRYVVCTLA